jgi:hypothetical protein
VAASAVRHVRAGVNGGPADQPPGEQRPLIVSGAIAAGAVTAAGLAVITVPVLVGWIAAPHTGLSLLNVLRAVAVLWLAAHHVAFALRGAGRIGMLPLGLVVVPGALLWRAGRWVVRTSRLHRLRHVGYAAVALAVPYSVLTGALAVLGRSSLAASSVLQAIACGLVLALAAGGLGAARALAPWSQLVRLLPQRERSMLLGVVCVLGIFAVAGSLLAGSALAVHLREFVSLERSLAPGTVGVLLLLLLQFGYLPNAIVWAVAFSLGPGFAVGAATVVAPTGSALAQLPAFPMLAALPPGLHAAMPGWLAPLVLSLPYLAGALGGLLLVRTAPTLTLEAAPLRGLACGAVSGAVLGLLAAFSGGPLGDGRLSAVGPSAWQVGIVSALEIGVAAAVSAGLANYLALRRAGTLRLDTGLVNARGATRTGSRGEGLGSRQSVSRIREPDDPGHVIFLDRWANDRRGNSQAGPRGPSALP